MTTSGRFILCADDYALAPGTSRAILDLIERGRLSAASCMTVSRFWPEHGAWLRPLADHADIGLHLTLTDHAPLAAMPRTGGAGRLPSLGVLMARAFAGQLDAHEIRAEVRRQIDAFTTVFGRPPSHIDGHQHIHLLPTIREAVLDAMANLPLAYLRNCRDSPGAMRRVGVALPKALFISTIGRGLEHMAHQRGIAVNDHFRGVHDFSGRIPFATLMARFTDHLTGRTLIMCHPGIPDEELRRADPLVDQRRAEYDYLQGSGFADLLASRGLAVARF